MDAKAVLEAYYLIKPEMEAAGLANYYHKVWMPQQIVLTTMEQNGWPFDPAVCEDALVDLRKEAEGLEDELMGWSRVWTENPYPESTNCFWEAPNPRSSKQLQYLLYGHGVREVAGVCVHGLGLPVPPVCGTLKAVRRTGRNKQPTDEMALLHLARSPETPTEVAPYLEKLHQWRKLLNDIGKLEKFPQAASEEPDRRLRFQLKALTDTGRLSASNQPIQQVPKKGKLRKAFIAEPGHKLVVADFSGLEMRILAHFLEVLFGDTTLKEDILGADVHSSTAKRIWPETLEAFSASDIKADKAMAEAYRDPAKIVNYAINYGKTEEG
jgi:DNA polymerase I-like protein with 3'-5' exonuclease and polymerase domains